MTLSDIKTYIFRRSKTNTTSFPAADMVIAINNAIERVETLIRQWTSNYVFTRITSNDLSTGTLVPKFNSLFHELLGLWPAHQYATENSLKSASGLLDEIQIKEAEMVRWYAGRRYRIFTVTIATPGVFTLDDHGFLSGDRVIFETTGALPTGLSAETWYYVIGAGLGTHTFRVASTRDGTAIDTTGSQSGTHFVGAEKPPQAKPKWEDNR